MYFEVSGASGGSNLLTDIADLPTLAVLSQTVASFSLQGSGFSIEFDGAGFADYAGALPTDGAITSFVITTDGGLTTSFYDVNLSASDLGAIIALGGAAADDAFNAAIFGGDDDLYGDAGPDVLSGLGGLDYLAGFGGDDTLIGGAGDDYMSGGAGVDSFNGGDGGDSVTFDDGNETQGAVANLLTQTITNDGFGNAETMTSIENFGFGTAFADTLTGDDNANSIGGGVGDTLIGNGGDDTFDLQGAATVDGGSGNNTITFEDFAAVPDNNGDGFADYIFSDHGVTVDLTLGSILDDGFGNSSTITNIQNVEGTFFADHITGDASVNHLSGGDGADLMFGMGGDDQLEGGDGNDELFGDGNYGDAIAGADTLDGGAGDDVLRGGAGVDTFIGGDGEDRVSLYFYNATQAASINLATQTVLNDGFGNTETMSSVEDFGAGTAFADTIIGDDNSNLIITGAGDIVSGAGGNDFFSIRGMATSIDGGGGTDWISYFQSVDLVPDLNADGLADEVTTTNGVTVNLATGQVIDGFGNVGTVTSIENVSGGDYNDTITGDAGTNDLTGWLGENTLNGGDGDDYIESGPGVDHINGGNGRDLVYFDLTAVTQGVSINLLTQTIANDGYGHSESMTSIEYFQGYYGESLNTIYADTLIDGNDAANLAMSDGDTVNGNGGDDFIAVQGANGATIGGGAGTDMVLFTGAKVDRFGYVTEYASTGVNINLETGVISNDGFGGSGVISGVENVVTFHFNATITGDVNANLLGGGDGDDTLSGGGGDDTLSGNEGNDILTGGDGDDYLDGSDGNDTLDGGPGADTLFGGAGNDTYIVSGDEAISESSGNGIDLVQSSISFQLAANFENLTLTGSAAINGIGNTLANTITGNSGANVLNGGTGADTLSGGGGNDTYVVDNVGDVVTEGANAGTDQVQSSISYQLGANVEKLTLTGSAAINGVGNTVANIITGNSGANVLNGGAGADTLSGGGGNDTYVVDNAGDVVAEALNAGTDEVQSSITYVLGANLEHLVLTGSAAINGTGNALGNIVTGNSGINILDGGAGDDVMNGGAGNDTIIGGAGADKVTGGDGVDAASYATATAGVTANLFDHTLNTGDAAGDIFSSIEVLTGSAFNDTLTGTSAANRLDGGAGADTMIGGAGADTYAVDNVGDVVSETLSASGGIDKVVSSISYTLGANLENLTLTGSAAINGTGNSLANTLYGNSGANTLNGGAGDDTLLGNAGHDILKGGAGHDTFVFSSLSAADNDTISDFSHVDDTIDLDNAIFTALGPDGALASTAFWSSTTGVAHDADDRIIYNATTGQLYYDADGNGSGAAILIATLAAHPSLDATDFGII